MKSPIEPDAAPVKNHSPYLRIDPLYPVRKATATRADMNEKIRQGITIYTLMDLYDYDPLTDLYHLRKEHL